ncbi:unnamed protein product, partial [Rotaria socialis]
NQTYVNNDRWRLNEQPKTHIGIIYLNCNFIDWSHPSSSLSWLFTIYFQTFERRFHTLVVYLRTNYRLPTLSNDLNVIEKRDRLV